MYVAVVSIEPPKSKLFLTSFDNLIFLSIDFEKMFIFKKVWKQSVVGHANYQHSQYSSATQHVGSHNFLFFFCSLATATTFGDEEKISWNFLKDFFFNSSRVENVRRGSPATYPQTGRLPCKAEPT